MALLTFNEHSFRNQLKTLLMRKSPFKMASTAFPIGSYALQAWQQISYMCTLPYFLIVSLCIVICVWKYVYTRSYGPVGPFVIQFNN